MMRISVINIGYHSCQLTNHDNHKTAE